MADSNDQLRMKRAFFQAFDNLSGDSSEEHDSEREASERALKKTPGETSTSKQKRSNGPGQPITREIFFDPPRETARVGSQVKLHSTTPRITSKTITASPEPKVTSKNAHRIVEHKELSTSRVQPTRSMTIDPAVPSKKLFDGLHFYFFPNNDVAPARRMRIAKAIEFGAIWQRNWNDSVTHVILDKSVDFRDLLKFLRLASLPGQVCTVTENYAAECIGFRAILDPQQSRFIPKGIPEPAKAVHSIGLPNSSSSASLQLKSGRSKAGRKETPRKEEYVLETAKPIADLATERVLDSFENPEIGSNAELDVAILQARALQQLPFEEEEDDRSSRPGTSEGVHSDNEKDVKLELLKQKRTKLDNIQDKFQCMQKHTGKTSSSPNQGTIEVLQKMADYYSQTGDEWRIRAYRRAITTLRAHPAKVCIKEEALALPNIGERLAAKIEEIVVTNRLRRLENALAEPQDQILQCFMKIYGAGVATASKWVRQGHKTLDDLLAKAELTENQRVGIQHYEDFQLRIPRPEVEQHGEIVRKRLQQFDSDFRVIIGGSYRRGSTDSGDIDCIITHLNAGASHIRAVCTDQVIPTLFRTGFLTVGLAITSRDDGSKWHGASCLPGSKVWRRIDFLFVPPAELGAALIYFTGNDIFNRSLRLLASKKGLRLNQRGLYKDVLRTRGRERVSDGTLVEGRDEKEIFRILGVPWRPPEHRIC